MTAFTEAAVERYLTSRLGSPVHIVAMRAPGGHESADLKGYGYGVPLRIDYEIGSVQHSAMLETVSAGPFGHEHKADRAQILIWSHDAFNRLPRHVRSLDVGGFTPDGTLLSTGAIDEFVLLAATLRSSGGGSGTPVSAFLGSVPRRNGRRRTAGRRRAVSGVSRAGHGQSPVVPQPPRRCPQGLD